MNAPLYFMLHALPMVVIVGTISLIVGACCGMFLWKSGAQQTELLCAEIEEYERQVAELRKKKDGSSPAE